MSRKYHATIVETLIHSFTVEVEEGEDLKREVEAAFLNINKLEQLTDYDQQIASREVDDVRPI